MTLLCPKNDAESYLIIELAKKLDFKVLVSEQSHGARLEKEPELFERLMATGEKEVWIVEIPEPKTEKQLRHKGYKLKIIDHHVYHYDFGKLDRSKNLSSLEQFIKLAKISNKDLVGWGYDSRLILGIGILDRGYTGALRKKGYQPAEIKKVLALEGEILSKIWPNLKETSLAAKQIWAEKEKRDDYIIVKADVRYDIRSELVRESYFAGLDQEPLIVSSLAGKKIYVQNVKPRIVRLLNKKVDGHTFVFGMGRCWGVDNIKSKKTQKSGATLEDIFAILNI